MNTRMGLSASVDSWDVLLQAGRLAFGVELLDGTGERLKFRRYFSKARSCAARQDRTSRVQADVGDIQ